MSSIEDKFALLATDNAPGQEGRQKAADLGPSGNSIRLNFSQDREAALSAIARACALIERYRK